MNICGLVVHARPEQGDRLCAAIEDLPGAEVHARAPDGRLVVTVEDHGEACAGDTVLRLHRLPGVLSAAIVYHSFEPEAAASEGSWENQ